LAVAQRVRRHATVDACGGGSGGKATRQPAFVERCVSVPVGEQPAMMMMGPPQVAQLVEDRLWQRLRPFLVALTDDAQHLVGPVDGADLQRGGLGDAQAARIHEGEARLVDWVADGAEQVPDLILRQCLRQPLLPWRGDPFFPRTTPRYGRACGDRGNADRTARS